MASGVAYAVRSLAEDVEVIGVQPAGAPAMALSWRRRTVVETDRIETIADGVAGRCPIPEVLDDRAARHHDPVRQQHGSCRLRAVGARTRRLQPAVIVAVRAIRWSLALARRSATWSGSVPI